MQRGVRGMTNATKWREIEGDMAQIRQGLMTPDHAQGVANQCADLASEVPFCAAPRCPDPAEDALDQVPPCMLDGCQVRVTAADVLTLYVEALQLALGDEWGTARIHSGEIQSVSFGGHVRIYCDGSVEVVLRCLPELPRLELPLTSVKDNRRNDAT